MAVKNTASIKDIREGNYLYDYNHEHDACGMGFVASIDIKLFSWQSKA